MNGIAERVKADGITAEAEPAAAPAWASPDDGIPWYRVTLRYQGRVLVTPLGTGLGIRELDAATVLEGMISDATSAGQPFGDWCADYDLDRHDEDVRRMYRRVRAQTAALRVFLGDAYRTYVFDGQDI